MISFKRTTTSLFLLSILCVMGCFGGEKSPDVDHISIDLERIDFDDLFLGLDSKEELRSELAVLESNYPDITKLYVQNIMNFKRRGDTSDLYLVDIKGFLESPLVVQLKYTIDSVFTDRNVFDHSFERAFKLLKYYFPNQPIPRLYYLMTEYSYAAFLFPDKDGDGLGISLDMFLGKGYPYKRLFPTNPAFSSYLTATFGPLYVVKKGMSAIIEDIMGKPKGDRLVDEMIHNGKKQYLLEKLIPETADSILWEYTEKQINWVQDNELNIYSYLASEDLLFSTDQMKYMKFVSPSPNSPGMPPEAPGRTANFIGYKIIEAYMNQAGASLEELIAEKDAQKILNVARYKPSI